MHKKPRNIHNKPRIRTKTLLRTNIIIKIERKKKCFLFNTLEFKIYIGQAGQMGQKHY